MPERSAVSGASLSDFVFVNLFRPPVGAPMKPGAVNELFTALGQRVGLGQAVVPHAMRHACSPPLSSTTGRDPRRCPSEEEIRRILALIDQAEADLASSLRMSNPAWKKRPGWYDAARQRRPVSTFPYQASLISIHSSAAETTT